MLEPDLYIFMPDEDEKLKSLGPAKLEWQTPREFLESTPLEPMETERWGATKVRFVRLPLPEIDPPGYQYYALVERFEEVEQQGHVMVRPNPQWALVMIDEAALPQFKTMFKEFCEQ
jgi:hypothetical protein